MFNDRISVLLSFTSFDFPKIYSFLILTILMFVFSVVDLSEIEHEKNILQDFIDECDCGWRNLAVSVEFIIRLRYQSRVFI